MDSLHDEDVIRPEAHCLSGFFPPFDEIEERDDNLLAAEETMDMVFQQSYIESFENLEVILLSSRGVCSRSTK
ncbi:hypothetical protein MASR2M79_18760 [Aminivibrio sp.]